MYQYNATVVRVIDGDTVIMDVDLGFYMTARMSCRLEGINAIELHSPGGPEARDHLAALFTTPHVVVSSVKADKYAGRFDGIILVTSNGAVFNVNDRMVLDGYAAAWNGLGTRPVPPWPIPQKNA